jgi:HD superfamily phosphohydrolase
MTSRYGVFMPAVSLTTGALLTYLIKPSLEFWTPDYWKALIAIVGLILMFAVYCLAFVLCVLYLRIARGPSFTSDLRRRWREVLLNSAPTEPTQGRDYSDRTARLQIRISMPEIVKSVVSELSREREEDCARLQKTIREFVGRNELRAYVNVLGNYWKMIGPFEVRPDTIIDDPIHGCVTLDGVLATIVSQPIVQRLGRVRQLSFSYTHFPSANHSRLSHVLGVAHNVERALMGVFLRGVYYEEGASDPIKLPDAILDRQAQIIRRGKLLAILHDLGHGPFGHALDNYVGYINSHQASANPDKIYSRLYIEKYLSGTLRKLGFVPEELSDVLNPEERSNLIGFDSLIGDLIDSSMDMDRMDYLMRDAHMTGLSMGFTNADALIECIRPFKTGDCYLLAYDSQAIEYMEHLLYAREAMYRSCYEHCAKRAAERIFERLIREVAQDDTELLDDMYILADEELLSVLRLVGLRSENAKHLLDQLIVGHDYSVIHDVQAGSPNLSEAARVWVKQATRGSGKGKASYIDQPAQWEDAIARASIGVERIWQIQVIVAPPNAYEQKFNAAQILYRDHKGYRTEEFFKLASSVKNVLSAMNPARARIRVMCPRNMSDGDREKITNACREELGW